MLAITITYTLLDDPTPVEVVTSTRDMVELERRYSVTVQDLADASTRKMEHVLFLGWSAARRTGRFAADFEAFIDQLDEFLVGGSVEPDPTPAGP